MTTLKYQLCDPLGSGGSAIVFHGIETTSKVEAAVKKLRTSLKIKRPILQYEARITQLLQGHPSVPVLYGYGRLPHFEYISMELLGPNLSEVHPGPLGIKLQTVVEFAQQALSVLQHIHTHGLVHRDIKFENFLCSRSDPFRIKLVDFGIAYPIEKGPPSQYDPVKERREIVGTHESASLNSHDGIDLTPRDDLESLAYILISLYYGDLPWCDKRRDPFPENIIRMRAYKAALTGGISTTIPGFPSELGELLDYSRSLEFDQIPDYVYWLDRFTSFGNKIGYKSGQPLDWGAREDQIDKSQHPLISQAPSIPIYKADESEESSDYESTHNSYYGLDISEWEIMGERDVNLTLTLTSILPTSQVDKLDKDLPEIVEVTVWHELPKEARLQLKGQNAQA